MTTVGHWGDSVRADVQVTVEDSATRSVEVESSVAAIYGKSLRAQALRVLAAFGDPPVRISVRDSGALPFVIEARLEAALCQHLNLALPRVELRESKPIPERLRRTRLYLPGDVPKVLPNGVLYRPDAAILDLEDSVPPDAKFAARALARRALSSLDWGDAEVMVRINGEEDLEATLGADTILVPKAESAEQIAHMAARLEDLGSEALLIPLIESALGISRAFEIASASPRVVALAIGLEDYLSDIGATRTLAGDESAYAHGQIVNAARAAGVAPLASVFPNFEDEAALIEYAQDKRAKGFEGIGCIHPRQIRPVHAAFRPSNEQLEQAKAIVDGFEASSGGAISVNGKMVDAPVYRRALDVLARGAV